MVKITAVLATLQERIPQAQAAIKSIASQVEAVKVVLNVQDPRQNIKLWREQFIKTIGINKVEKIVPNIELIISDNRLGDAERFYPVNKGYYISIDDDLIYPPDYVETMLKAYRKYGGIITFHGKYYHSLNQQQSYYRSLKIHADIYRCLYDVERDAVVHIPGSGVMFWNQKDVDLSYRRFERKNMSDLEVARLATCPITVLAHRQGWIQYNPPDGKTIHELYYNDDTEQTELINQLIKRWKTVATATK